MTIDNKPRCAWPTDDDIMLRYHTELGLDALDRDLACADDSFLSLLLGRVRKILQVNQFLGPVPVVSRQGHCEHRLLHAS